MLRDSLESICSLLLSNKIRDRNDALERLQDINFSLPSTINVFDHEILTKLVKSLDVYLNSDTTIYEKSNTNATVEARLNKASHILRLVITNIWCNPKFIQLYKPRQSEKLIDILLRHCTYDPIDEQTQIFDPTVLNMTKSLNTLMDMQCFRDHLFSTTFEKLTDKTIRSLNIIVGDSGASSKNENLIIEFLSLLYSFVNPKYTSDLRVLKTKHKQYYNKIFNICLSYFKNIFADNKRERESTINIIRIINKCMITLASENIKLCHQFYKLGVQYILEVKAISSLKLVSEIAVFINLIPPFVALQNLQKLHGDNWDINSLGEMRIGLVSEKPTGSDRLDPSVKFSVDEDAFSEVDESIVLSDSQNSNEDHGNGKRKREILDDSNRCIINLGKLVEIVFGLLGDNSFHKQLQLHKDSIHLNIFSSETKDSNLFFFRQIYLKKNHSSTPWLLRLGISRLVISYYDLKRQTQGVKVLQKPNKIQKLTILNKGHSFQLTDYLSVFESPVLFFLSVIFDDPYKGGLDTVFWNQIFALFLGYISSFQNLKLNRLLMEEIFNNKIDILSKLINAFERNNLSVKYWIYLEVTIFHSICFSEAFVEMQPHNELTSSDAFDKLLKYSLELLKEQEMFKLACVFLSHVSVYYFSNDLIKLPLKKSLIQQYENLIELSEINGPPEVNTESIVFWITTSIICKNFKLTNAKLYNSLSSHDVELYSYRISNWLISKFETLKLLSSCSDIFFTTYFVLWVIGQSPFLFYAKDYARYHQRYDGEKLLFFEGNKESFKFSNYVLQLECSNTHETCFVSDIDINVGKLLTNSLTETCVKNCFFKFIDSTIMTTTGYNWVIWILSFHYIFEAKNVEYSSFLRGSENMLLDKFRTFRNIQDLSRLLHTYYDCTLSFPQKQGCSLKSIISTSEVAELTLLILNSNNSSLDFISEEVDIFDSFIGLSTTESYINISDYSVYNCNNIMLGHNTIEQKTARFILRFSDSSSISPLEDALTFTSKIANNFQFLATQYELLKFVETCKPEISESTLDKLYNHLTILLENHTSKTYEATVIVICNLFEKYCNIWIKSQIGIESDGKALYDFLTNIDSRNMLHTEKAAIAFFRLLLQILKNLSDNHNGFEKSTVYYEVILKFSAFSNLQKFEVAEDIRELIKSQPANQIQTYSSFVKSFKSPQQAVETSALFCYFMTSVSQSSESFVIASVCNLLELSKFDQIRVYLPYAIESITFLNGIKNPYLLFWNFTEVFFKCWKSFGYSIAHFPYNLFGFTSINHFYSKTYKEIVALSLAYDQRNTVTFLSQALSMKILSLVKDSMALSISLSWTKGGSKNKIFRTLEQYYTSSKMLKSSLKEQFILISYHLLRYCDCSSEEDLLMLFDASSNDENQLLSKGSYKTIFLEEYEMQIKPKSCIDMINYFAEICGIQKIWTVPLVYHLSSKILLLIDCSLLKFEKLLHIRRLKLLLMLSARNLKNSKICQLVINNTILLLKDKCLRSEVASIITFLLNSNSENPSILTELICLPILDTLLLVEKCQSTLKIANALDNMHTSAILHDYDELFIYALNSYIEVKNDLIPNLTRYVNASCREMSKTDISISFLSSLFEKSIEFQTSSSKIDVNGLTSTFIQNLYNIKVKYALSLSDPMLAWIGRCIGVYYQFTGCCPKIEKFEFDTSMLEQNTHIDFNKEVKSLDMVFKLMIEDSHSSSLKNKYCFETIVGVIIHKQVNQNENLTSVLSYGELFQYMEEYIQPMGNYMCSLLIEQVEDETLSYYKDTLDQALNGFTTLIKAYRFENWLSQILFSIINELSSQSSIIILLANYICHIPEFAIKCFCPLILYYVENQPQKRSQCITKMVQEFFKQDMATLEREAIEIFVELVLLMRFGNKTGNDKFISLLGSIDIPLVIEAALHIKKFKTALMLFEDYYMKSDIADNNAVLNDSFYSKWLKLIYFGLEDTDLSFGLPIVPELDYGLQSIRLNSKWGEMMFSNAMFDTNIMSKTINRAQSLNEISKGMMDMGWSGASNIISEYAQKFINEKNADNNDILYEQLWKLNQWDIPKVKHPTSENQCIYSLLKDIKEHPASSKLHCEISMKNLISLDIESFSGSEVTSSDKLEAWMRTLAISNNFHDIILSRNLNLAEFMESTEWFKEATNKGFENILLSRRVLFEIMSTFEKLSDSQSFSLDSRDCWTAVVNETHRYNTLMVVKNQKQKAINSSVMLNQISKNIFKDADAAINRVAKFNLSRAFWIEKSDTRFPVETLKDIIKNDKSLTRTLVSEEENDKVSTVRISTNFLLATLSQWCDECKQETSGGIMETYIDKIVDNFTKFPNSAYEKDTGLTYHIMAKFCDDQILKNRDDSSLEKLVQSISLLEKDIASLTKYIKEDNLPHENKKYAIQDLNRLKLRHKTHSKELTIVKKERNTYVVKAVNFYFKSIAYQNHDFVETDIDRFCSLWIEHSDIQMDENELLNLSSFNFVPWCNQLVSRLLNEKSLFQNLLKKLVINIAISHPFHILYMLKSLRMIKEESDDTAAVSRGNAANEIWKILALSTAEFHVEGLCNIVSAVDSFSDKAVEIANVKLKNTRKVALTKLPNGSWWKTTLPELCLPSPVKSIAVQKNRPYRIDDLPIMVRVSDTIVTAASGVSHPKIMKFLLSTGETQKMLMKSPDDLRQDSIMKQVFEKVNNLLRKDIETRKRNLRIITYNVLPLGPTSGILEFVPNSMPLIDILKSLHKHDTMNINEARMKMKEVQSHSKLVRYQAYKDICKKINPCLKDFFFNNFTLPDSWFVSRTLYCHGIATTSITGYILGIGDRHCNNILLDKSSGEPIQIDFGIAFDQGKLLPVPETVPFRLTRDIVDAMGISNVNGMFIKSCEQVLRVLRSNAHYIASILDVLKYDPLYSWTLSPLRKQKLHQIYYIDDATNENNGFEEFVKTDIGSEANNAIETVKKKLEAKGLSDEAVVRELIREAVDPKNLSLIFMGWSPFL